MRLHEFLPEAFDSPVNGQIVRASADHFDTRATVGSETVNFTSHLYTDENQQMVADLLFGVKTNRGITYGKTNTGNQMAIFSFVLESLGDMIARYQPDVITFDSAQEDRSRTQVYQRLIQRFAHRVGYRLESLTKGSGYDYFVLKRNT